MHSGDPSAPRYRGIVWLPYGHDRLCEHMRPDLGPATSRRTVNLWFLGGALIGPAGPAGVSTSVVREAAHLAKATHEASGEAMTASERDVLMAAVAAGHDAFRFAASTHGGMVGICSNLSHGNSFHTRAKLRAPHYGGAGEKPPRVIVQRLGEA